jgi:hypothetical protein
MCRAAGEVVTCMEWKRRRKGARLAEENGRMMMKRGKEVVSSKKRKNKVKLSRNRTASVV